MLKTQQVQDKQLTDNPALDHFVYGTVRPGYLFGERLLRAQKVIIYAFPEQNPVLEESVEPPPFV